MTALATVCLAGVLAALVWPAAGRRARRRRVLGLATARPRPAPGRKPADVREPTAVRVSGRIPLRVLAAAGAVAAAVLGGPVAGIIAAVYGTVAVKAVGRRQSGRARSARRAELVDAVGSAAADLRAGLTAASALAGIPAGSADPLSSRVGAAVRLAERTGAPLAEVLERIEADARGTDRASAASAAQAAGSRATAWLLTGLPAGGIALGFAIGVDPLAVLLHTPLGAVCALGAVVLQLAGIAWANRLIRTDSPVARPAVTRRAGVRVGWGLVSRRAGSARRRLAQVAPLAHERTRGRRIDLVRLAAGLTGIVAGLLFGGWLGIPAGIGVAVALDRGLRRLVPAGQLRARRLSEAAELPLAADLLAVTLRGGAPVDRAAASVADALPGPLGDRLGRVARMLRLGGTPAEAWAQLRTGDPPPGAERLVRAAVRSAEHGSALAGALGRLADDLRADRTVAAEAAARRAAVLIVLPLGLCFLPAFILAGLVPVIVAVLGDVL